MSYDLNIRGWMGAQELHDLEKLSSNVPENGIIVEVGSLMGRSTYCLAKSCHPSVKVYSIDIWNGEIIDNNFNEQEIIMNSFPKKNDRNTLETFLNNVKDCHNIIPIKLFESSIPDICPDLVFIDASHTNPSDLDIINFWLPKIKKGGVLAGHDYGENFPDVVSNVKMLENKLSTTVNLLAGSLWSFNI